MIPILFPHTIALAMQQVGSGFFERRKPGRLRSATSSDDPALAPAARCESSPKRHRVVVLDEPIASTSTSTSATQAEASSASPSRRRRRRGEDPLQPNRTERGHGQDPDMHRFISGLSHSVRSRPFFDILRSPEAWGLNNGPPYTTMRWRERPNLDLATSRSSRRSSLMLGFKRSMGRTRTSALLLLLLMAFGIWVYSIRDWLVMVRFKARDAAYEKELVWTCRLRKEPMLFIRAEDQVAVVWESNCDRPAILAWSPQPLLDGTKIGQSRKGDLKGRRAGKSLEGWSTAAVEVTQVGSGRYVYSSIVRPLLGGRRYNYRVGWVKPRAAGTENPNLEQPTKFKKVLASYSFDWTGPAVIPHLNLESADSNATNATGHLIPSQPTSFHIGALADNQYNVRTFHRVLLKMLAYSRRIPSNSPSPPLLIHAGDQVQNPHNLAQWQTDFWDAMTSMLPIRLGQTTPIVQARGNHDWDRTGANVYVGGSPPRSAWLTERQEEPVANHPGTYFAYSPHQRCRILVLDSNLDSALQVEQELWLKWELARPEWTKSTIRIVVVHVSPFLEFWDTEAWTNGKESHWSVYVRHRLAPLWAEHGANLVMSGHQHAYSRGFLPHSLHRSYSSVDGSASLDVLSKAIVSERGWEKIAKGGVIEEPGTVYTIFGGAGGTLDQDRVEDWGFYDRSIKGQHHFAWLGLGFAGVGIDDSVMGEVRMGDDDAFGEAGSKKVYRTIGGTTCSNGTIEVVDVLEWRAIGLNEKVLDAFRIESFGCAER
ncbi:BQ5605_C003g01923 [Microbotryum silenes-dioicae]|uniref:BQ5605_C003g01923 protein n=1 Tax=Microbotryum silenes-dioicae TaxID=796604 RepID=A0A2X0M487_9BASI|nr:BQ5605_C003g01923 [Microbotryum silenes-dioicae]